MNDGVYFDQNGREVIVIISELLNQQGCIGAD